MIVKVSGGRAEDLLKRALFLAYDAAGAAQGMGILQAMRLGGTAPSEEQVWRCIVNQEDYQGFQRGASNDFYADYVFGRMVKWGARLISPDQMEVRSLDDPLRPDYQGFARRYPTSRALLDAAAEQLSVKYAEEKEAKKCS